MTEPWRAYLLWALNQEPWPEEYLRRALECLPPSMTGEVASLRRWQDRQARLQGRLLLRLGLARLGLVADLATWSRAANGKPLLDGCAAQFNISHTAGLTVCALGLGSPLGVDVERLQPLERQELAGFFTPAELAAMRAATDPGRELLRLWTAKEALLKASGVGLMAEPGQVQVLDESVVLEGRRWWITRVDLGPEHLCHLAGLHARPLVQIWPLHGQELLAGCPPLTDPRQA